MTIQMNPVLIGFLLAIPMWAFFMLVYFKLIKPKGDRKREVELEDRKNIINTLKSEEFKNLKSWIQKSKEEKYKERDIKKSLKENGWHPVVIQEAFKQIKEREYYENKKNKAKIPSEITTKSRGKETKRETPRTNKGTDRDISRNGEIEQRGLLQIPPTEHVGRDKRESKWDWRTIKQNRTNS